MSESCIFCRADGEFPPEHWLPQWISRAVIGSSQVVEHHDQEGNVWHDTIFDLTVPRVCAKCNHGWMSDIETRARRVVLPLIQGKPGSKLPQPDQRVLATWCFAKVITLEIGRPADQPRTYPEHLYVGFLQHRHPPPASCAISIGRRETPSGAEPYVWFRSQGQNRTLPELGDSTWYRTALVIGHLVVDVFGVLDSRAELHLEDEDRRLTRVWPVTARPISLSPVSYEGIRNNELI